jgi:hypothetical protein
MRARNIKPGFFINEDLAEVDAHGRLLFIGLWCLADREGKLEDRPKRIKGELFRYDAISYEAIDAQLMKLADLGLIIRYEIDGLRYIFIPNFLKHQSPHYNEKPSTIPHPLLTKDESTFNQGRNKAPTMGGVLPPDSLNPDILNPDLTDLPDFASGDCPLKPVSRNFEDEFKTTFYPAYPKKKDPAGALKAYLKAGKAGGLPSAESLLAILEEQKTWPEWNREAGKFIPHPASWLNGERWKDERSYPPVNPLRRNYAELKTTVIVND